MLEIEVSILLKCAMFHPMTKLQTLIAHEFLVYQNANIYNYNSEYIKVDLQ